jgi:hypothetical protein
MELKHLKYFKIFEEIDAFSRASDKYWVLLQSSGEHGDERSHYFRRYEPENILPKEMVRLKKAFNEFNGGEVKIEPVIPEDNGYKEKVGSFSVKLNCNGKIVPFNFHKRWDDWWIIYCKLKGKTWDDHSFVWCEGTKIYGNSVVLCDSIEGIEEFLNDYQPKFNYSFSSNTKK